MKRFIYKKVVTGMPNPAMPWWQVVTPPAHIKRSWRHQGYFIAPLALESITIDKWAPTYPVMRQRRFRRDRNAFFIDALFGEPPIAPDEVLIDRWFMPSVQPRRRAQTLASALMPTGTLDFAPVVDEATQPGIYKLKLFSRSRKTDL